MHKSHSAAATANGRECDRSAEGNLLRRIAEDAPGWALSSWPRDRVESLADAGLGPILHRLAGSVPSPYSDLLQGADLTAQVITENAADATEEILRAVGSAAAEVILLKGAAAALRHYPQPHLRVMGDIDLLVPPSLYRHLPSVLRDLGYVQESDLPPQFFETHHHEMPFFHPQKQLWIEVHRALFPPSWSCAHESCFAVDTVFASTVPLTFREIPIRALTDETHLLHTCAHWAGSFSSQRGLLGVVDVIYLLSRGQPPDWDTVLRKAPGGWARRSLGLMLGYLLRHEAIELDASMAKFVAACLRPVGAVNTRLLYRLLDSRLIRRRQSRLLTEPNVCNIWQALLLREGSPYLNLVRLPEILLFPPNRADRFSPVLAAKRIWSLLRG